MKRLLLLSSDELLCKSVHLMVSHERISVHCTEPSVDEIEVARCGGFDLIVVDVDPAPPATDAARQLLPRLRAEVPQVPFLLLVAAGTDDDMLQRRNAPCGCLAKPFHREDLSTRIDALLRAEAEEAVEELRFGRLKLDLMRKRARVDGKDVGLTRKEYEILELLALRAGTTLTKGMFLTSLYPDGNEPEMKIIDVFVCKLRKKLNAALDDVPFVHTVWGRGYVFRAPEDGDKAQDRRRAGNGAGH